MDLENYTNINIYKRTFEEREVANCHNMIEQPHNHLGSNKEHRGFNPYQNNEGTVVGKCSQLNSLQTACRTERKTEKIDDLNQVLLFLISYRGS